MNTLQQEAMEQLKILNGLADDMPIELNARQLRRLLIENEAVAVFEVYYKFYQIIDDQPEMYEWFRNKMKGNHAE